MPRKHLNARPVHRGVAKRGRHRSHTPLYARNCDACGFFEFSSRASFVTEYRRCPSCKA